MAAQPRLPRQPALPSPQTDLAVQEKRHAPVPHLETAARNTVGVVLRLTTAVLAATLDSVLARVVARPRLLRPQPRLRRRRFRLMGRVELLLARGVRLVTAARSMGGVGLRLVIVGLGARPRLVHVLRGLKSYVNCRYRLSKRSC